MNYELISVKAEQDMKQRIMDLLIFEKIEKVLAEASIEDPTNRIKQIHEGYSFKVNKDLSPKLFDLFTEVKTSLAFDDDIEVFVSSSADLNAFAVPKLGDLDTNLIVITSGLIDKFDDDELKFVIGHEIGHLISGYSRINRVINFLYPEGGMPFVIDNKIRFWQQLSELTADRYGFIASPKLNKIISGFFKLTSGLNTEKISFNSDVYLKQTDELVDKLKEEPTYLGTSHPINPIRLKALKYFSESNLYKQVANNEEIAQDDALVENTNSLAGLLTVIADSDLDYYRMYFIASGGLLVAMSDEEFSKQEMEKILYMLGGTNMFPRQLVDELMEGGIEKITELFEKSIAGILEINPADRYSMLDYLISVVISDQQIKDQEIEMINNIGSNYLGLSKKEIAQGLASSLQRAFVPDILAG
jgi:Zn-dependent protease with chaperone function/uncharacterized tellurite resistance protein B-like protein